MWRWGWDWARSPPAQEETSCQAFWHLFSLTGFSLDFLGPEDALDAPLTSVTPNALFFKNVAYTALLDLNQCPQVLDMGVRMPQHLATFSSMITARDGSLCGYRWPATGLQRG